MRKRQATAGQVISIRTAAYARSSRLRSAVTNGTRWFIDGDSESKWTRRFADLVQTYVDHIGGAPTAPQVALIRRIATLDVSAEFMEGEMSKGAPADLSLYNVMAGTQRRLLEQLGFNAPKLNTPNPIADHFSRPYRAEPA